VPISEASQEESIYRSCSLLPLAICSLNCGTKEPQKTQNCLQYLGHSPVRSHLETCGHTKGPHHLQGALVPTILTAKTLMWHHCTFWSSLPQLKCLTSFSSQLAMEHVSFSPWCRRAVCLGKLSECKDSKGQRQYHCWCNPCSLGK
jgi:hypothetical protein